MNTANVVNSTLAMVFPGQGSQTVGMLSDLAGVNPQVLEAFTQASEVLGYDLWRLVQDGPAGELNQTASTQPAMLAAGVAVWNAWSARGGGWPALMAGHSLGEYTALVCTGALEYTAAVALVAERGRCMQSAVPAGAGGMAAILGLDDAAVEGVCEQAEEGEVVAAVNYNSPGQVVIAGDATAVERATGLAREAGAKRAVLLPVSVPSHCSLMTSAAIEFGQRLAEVEIATPRVPVIQNVDAIAHTDPALIRDNLGKQLYSPVQWVRTVQAMAAQGVDRIIEAGPGKVLAGLCRRIDKNITAEAVHDAASLDTALTRQ